MRAERLPLLGPFLEAAQETGLSDDAIGRQIDHWFPEVWEPGFFATPQSDGFHIHALPCGSLAGPDHGGLTYGEMPTDAELDEAFARAEADRARFARRLADERGSGM